ncbi:bifunctional diguanylate cyclase/phosphodiesterase [Vibrio mytili]|uniref:putative bifunctional diguanylate cyclase/phosphodiesterase n=1 Tax=Vibrio mytili TaxID=50718 RepID=UPI002F4121FC
MKKTASKITSRKTITISAVLVAIYLAVLIAITSVGQTKLKDSQYRELDLKVKSYATTLNNFFTVASEDIDNLSNDKTVQTFFANLASGMSIEYGLGASLINLKHRFDGELNAKLINDLNIYDQLTLVGNDGNTIVAVGQSTPHLVDIKRFTFNEQYSEEIYARQANDSVLIQVVKKVEFSGKPVGYLVADLNQDVVIEHLTNQEHEDSYSRLLLKINDVEMVVWDSISKHTTQSHGKNYQLSSDHKNLYFEVAVPQHHFKLMAWFEPLSSRDIFTSRLFIWGLSVFAILIVVALCCAFVANNNRLELKIKLEEEKKRKDILSEQNIKLTNEIARRKASESELAFQAKYDTLTNLPNRSYGSERLSLELQRAARCRSKVLVMFIDLDHFKQINDSSGHLVGDEILKLSAKRLRQVARKTDLLARIGGDEFLLVLPDLPDNETAKRVASNVLSAFVEPLVFNHQEFFLTSSVGMSVYPDDGETAEQLLACADMAMYRVKQEGRDGFCFYDQNMNNALQRYLDLESRLRNAISNQLLELYYQPIIELKTEKIVGVEALMRWKDEKYGFVNPEEFISIAEKNGLIHQIGEFAIKQSCIQAAQWQSITPLFVSVNFSSVQFRYCEKLLQSIKTNLSDSGLPADKFDVEVTESLLFNHDTELLDMLNDLRTLGTKLTIDDFGTGYSALSYLQKFPFDRLKIDRSFMQNMFENDSDRELVNVIIAMAKALNLKIIAEGIEDRCHVDYLNDLNCEFGQGFYFSRPVPAEEFEVMLKQTPWL